MSDEIGSVNPMLENIVYGVDGDLYTAYRNDFVNLQESCCGYGNNHQEAVDDLIRQENGL